jgi:cell division septation protein DedD
MLLQKDNELIRTNRMLFGVSLAAVVLLGPSFIVGYVWGYRTARQNGPQATPGTALASSQTSTPISPPTELKPTQTTPAVRVNAMESPAAAVQAHQIAAGQVYLQLVSTAKSRSATIIDALRGDGFPVIASDVPDKPSLHRILIGPLHEGEVDKTRADLQSKGFPGDSAIERTF